MAESGVDWGFPEIADAVGRVCAKYDSVYWRACEEQHQPPVDFVRDLAADGWLGIMMPERLGGAGLPLAAAATMIRAITESGAGWGGSSAVQGYIFGPHPVVKYGTVDQQNRMLPPLISGAERPCFAITEPTTGSDTTRLKTVAVREGDVFVATGQKVWTTAAHYADRMMLVARTRPLDSTSRPVDGLSLFYTRLDPKYVDIRSIPKHGGEAVGSCELFIDKLPIPAEDLIGEEGKGFSYLLDSLNPERVLIAAGCIGLGHVALARAVDYAKERVVFDRPIGRNQAIQHPLAESWMELEAASLMVGRAAQAYENGERTGALANAAKYLAAEAANKVCRQAVITHGGFGYAKEYDVERFLRESMLPILAPVSQQLVLSYVAERVLGLPKSY